MYMWCSDNWGVGVYWIFYCECIKEIYNDNRLGELVFMYGLVGCIGKCKVLCFGFCDFFLGIVWKLKIFRFLFFMVLFLGVWNYKYVLIWI